MDKEGTTNQITLPDGRVCVISLFTQQEIGKIADFQLGLAKETENQTLDRDLVILAEEKIIKDPNLGFYITGKVQNKTVSCLMITKQYDYRQNREIWWYQSVYVQKQFRGSGIFKQMFKCIDDLASQTQTPLKLYVESHNQRALAVYQKLGMHDAGEIFIEDDFFFGSKAVYKTHKDLKVEKVTSEESINKFINDIGQQDQFSSLNQRKKNEYQNISQACKLIKSGEQVDGIYAIYNEADKQPIWYAFVFCEVSDWRNGIIVYFDQFYVKKGIEEKISREEAASHLFYYFQKDVKDSMAFRVYLNEKCKENFKFLLNIGMENSSYRIYEQNFD